MNITTAGPAPTDQHKWLKRASVLGFWFFFVKGILWMAAPLVFYYLA
jgi:hypothetical protein